jgi:hypothetical protein
MSYEILNFADRTPEPAAPDDGFFERLAFYSEIDAKKMAANIEHLANRNGRQWTMDDFVLSPPHNAREEDDAVDGNAKPGGELNLYHLTVEFLGWLHRIENVPYAKGELGRRELHRFIIDRHYGRLEYRESMLQSMQRDIDRKKGRRTKPVRKYRQYEHMLAPDPERLDRYLAGLLDMMNQLHHRASALFEFLPDWLRFPEVKQLIDAETRTQTMDRLARTAGSLSRILEIYTEDPAPG